MSVRLSVCPGHSGIMSKQTAKRCRDWSSACCYQQCRRRRMFAMMHLRNFCQVSTDEVRRAASDDAFACQSSALDRNSEVRRLNIRDNWSYAPLVENFWLRHCALYVQTTIPSSIWPPSVAADHSYELLWVQVGVNFALHSTLLRSANEDSLRLEQISKISRIFVTRGAYAHLRLLFVHATATTLIG